MVNFTHAVEKRLVDLVTENLDAINNKDKNANGNRRRIDTWGKFSNTLNAEYTDSNFTPNEIIWLQMIIIFYQICNKFDCLSIKSVLLHQL